ncbi:MAG: peptide ABC transporter substrate-binding protein [Oscillospiraceae bacterium]|jgi:ABC-type oligopeptide transport system substrate-binding subunit|nr:peptide ABC transporter substrate-binding protein [Oscillospiraceae bacterium]
MKQARRLLGIFLAAAVLFTLASCGKDSGENKELSYPLDEMPQYLDPAVATGSAAALILNNCFEGLLRQAPGEEMRLAPGVAERWSVSADGLRYTFYLRPDSRWRLPGGAEALLSKEVFAAFDARVKAADFVFGLRRVLEPGTHAPNAAQLFPIKNARKVFEGKLEPSALGVAATDDFTLEIQLEQPNANFLSLLTQPVFMPCHEAFFAATKGRYGLAADMLLCNGPFYLSRWDGALLRLRRNEEYKGNWKVAPAGVTLRLQPDSAQRLRLLGAEGGFSAVLLPASAAAQALPALAKGVTAVPLQNATLALLFQCATGALASVELRAALCAALDAAALGYDAAGLVPGSCLAGQGAYRQAAGRAQGIPFDEAKARKLWAQGLAALGKSQAALTLLCPPELEAQLLLALQQWQRLFGLTLRLTIETSAPAELQERLRAKDFDLAVAVLQSESAFALGFLQQLGAEEGLSGYRSKTLTALLTAAAQTTDPAQLAAGCKQAEEHLLQNAVVYPLWALQSHLLIAPGVEGLMVSPAGEQISFLRATVADG